MPDFILRDNVGAFVLLTPITDRAIALMRENPLDFPQWFGPAAMLTHEDVLRYRIILTVYEHFTVEVQR